MDDDKLQVLAILWLKSFLACTLLSQHVQMKPIIQLKSELEVKIVKAHATLYVCKKSLIHPIRNNRRSR